MARRTPRVKRNLPTWLNAISVGVRACNARKKLYDLENLEPRLLLSATELAIASGVTEIELTQSGSNVQVRQLTGVTETASDTLTADADGYTLNLSSGSDTITVTATNALTGSSGILTFNGSDGDDSITFNSAIDFGGLGLVVNAEDIDAGASADLDTTGDITFNADASSTSYTSSPTASIVLAAGSSLSAANITLDADAVLDDGSGSNLTVALSANATQTVNPTAEVEALGQLAATGSASITATATTRLDLDLSQYDLNLTLSPTANAVVGSQADVDAATFTLSAAIDGELDVDGNDGSQFDQTGDQSAIARIDLGADVDVTGSGDSAMTVTANRFD